MLQKMLICSGRKQNGKDERDSCICVHSSYKKNIGLSGGGHQNSMYIHYFSFVVLMNSLSGLKKCCKIPIKFNDRDFKPSLHKMKHLFCMFSSHKKIGNVFFFVIGGGGGGV